MKVKVYLFVIICVIISACEKHRDAPEANYSYTIDTNNLGVVNFKNTSLQAYSCAYNWDFGLKEDSTESLKRAPKHIFSLKGSYDVTLKVKNGIGQHEHKETISVSNGPYFTYLTVNREIVSAYKTINQIVIYSNYYDGNDNIPFNIKIPINAIAGSTYNIATNTLVTLSKLNSSGSTDTLFAKAALPCSSGTVIISKITPTEIRGTFATKMVSPADCNSFIDLPDGKFGARFK